MKSLPDREDQLGVRAELLKLRYAHLRDASILELAIHYHLCALHPAGVLGRVTLMWASTSIRWY
ncbi:hypothetical protein IV102_25255 [bacterium]|nr:hypothetical protein [bacterium]